jgi:hypothetical protein
MDLIGLFLVVGLGIALSRPSKSEALAVWFFIIILLELMYLPGR